MKQKYPRTFHLPWSLGATSDDKKHADVENLFGGKHIVMTEKMDGENTTIYFNGHTHARSVDSKSHPSRDWIKGEAARIAPQLPDGWRVCGENLYARHSIEYDYLNTYFLAFSIWNEKNECLSWKEFVEWCDLLEIEHVPLLYSGIWDVEAIQRNWSERSCFGEISEGYVIRTCESFKYKDFATNVAKYVRPNHVRTDTHWMHAEVVPNKIVK